MSSADSGIAAIIVSRFTASPFTFGLSGRE
jgi:hypothetical protein